MKARVRGRVQRLQRGDVTSDPDPKHISTLYVERQNLTMPDVHAEFTRLTNAFSKKVLNYAPAIALYFMHYNSGASIRRCASLRLWTQAWPTTCRVLRKSSHS